MSLWSEVIWQSLQITVTWFVIHVFLHYFLLVITACLGWVMCVSTWCKWRVVGSVPASVSPYVTLTWLFSGNRQKFQFLPFLHVSHQNIAFWEIFGKHFFLNFSFIFGQMLKNCNGNFWNQKFTNLSVIHVSWQHFSILNFFWQKKIFGKTIIYG